VKRTLLIAALLLAAASLVFAGGKAEGEAAGKTYTAAFGCVHSPETPNVKGMEWFAEKMGERTDGKVVINVFPGGSLGGNKEHLEGPGLGTMEMADVGSGIVSTYAAEYGIIDMPFIYRDKAHFRKVMDGPIGEATKKSIEESANINVVSYYARGPRHLFTKNRVVTEPGDLNGLKLRLPPIDVWHKAWTSLGAVPINVSWPEVYTALQTGVADAVEQDVAPFLSQALHEVTNHVMLTDHQGHVEFWIVNRPWFNSLPAEYQEIFMDTAAEAMDYVQKLVDESSEAMLLSLKEEHGMQVHEVNREAFVEALHHAATQVWEPFWPEGLYEQISSAGR